MLDRVSAAVMSPFISGESVPTGLATKNKILQKSSKA